MSDPYPDRLEAVVMCLLFGTTLPDEHHPFWDALELLAEGIDANFTQHGLARHERAAAVGRAAGSDGSGFTASSDTPDWAHWFWIDLPTEQPRRQEIARLIETHLSAARRALPHETWKVTFGGSEIAWQDGAGFSLPIG